VNPTITTGVLGVGDLDQAGSIALAKQANAMGFKIVIDFHYSDTWADPGNQTTPPRGQAIAMPNANRRLQLHFGFMTALAAEGSLRNIAGGQRDQLRNALARRLGWRHNPKR